MGAGKEGFSVGLTVGGSKVKERKYGRGRILGMGSDY